MARADGAPIPAIAWAAAFAKVSDSLTTGTAVLLVLYPVLVRSPRPSTLAGSRDPPDGCW